MDWINYKDELPPFGPAIDGVPFGWWMVYHQTEPVVSKIILEKDNIEIGAMIRFTKINRTSNEELIISYKIPKELSEYKNDSRIAPNVSIRINPQDIKSMTWLKEQPKTSTAPVVV